jgi:hypothetical protein
MVVVTSLGPPDEGVRAKQVSYRYPNLVNIPLIFSSSLVALMPLCFSSEAGKVFYGYQ